MDLWKTIRGNYRRAVIKISKWSKQPSGSGKQRQKKPRAYKYSSELSFLDDVFSLEETTDSLGLSSGISDEEDEKCQINAYG